MCSSCKYLSQTQDGETGEMDYDEACFMHLTPGVVHNFPNAVGVKDFCPLCTKTSQIPI